jgi:16S rRNA (uracil1498-N3)-methyltransferase
MARTPRVFVHQPLATGQQLALAEAEAAHLGRVLRVRPGEAVTLFDGSGAEFEAQIVAASRRRIEFAVGRREEKSRESPLELVLLQGICRSERMDWVVRKATELGVSAIRPVLTARSVVKLEPGRLPGRIEHWRAIAISACEQCGRNLLPDILPPLPVIAALAAHRDAAGVLLDPDSRSGFSGGSGFSRESGSGFGRESGSGFSRDGRDPQPLCLLVGPEGGLDDRERDAARQSGFTPIRMGPRILRTETAAITGIALLQARFGDLG